MTQEQTQQPQKRRLQGTVVSEAMDKTVVVQVERYEQHPMYGKYVQHRKRYKAHDEQNGAHVGDEVTIEECVPMSKEKKFKIV